MGRGASTISPETILFGETGARGSGLDELQAISLSSKQAVVLRGLRALSEEHPSAPGFEAYDICETASGFAEHPEQWLNVNTSGPVLSSLKRKGLVTRSESCLKGASGQVSHAERGWGLTTQGTMLAAGL
jgi:hypothetical protein